MTTSLLPRLEKCSGPDRALADEVLLACGWRTELADNGFGPSTIWFRPNGKQCWRIDLPNPLESLDAALTLVPEGWRIKLDIWRNKSHPHISHCTLETDADMMDRDFADDETMETEANNCKTPAIALVICALRARGIT